MMTHADASSLLALIKTRLNRAEMACDTSMGEKRVRAFKRLAKLRTRYAEAVVAVAEAV